MSPAQLRAAMLSVVALALVAHGSGLGGAFTFDDVHALVRHPVVNGEAPLGEAFTREWFGKPLGEGWSSSYRPIATLSFALVARAGGEALAQHFVNWVLYAGLCAMCLHVGRRVVGDKAAWIAALFFAVMPVHVEDVAAVVGRADVLAAGFGLLAFSALEGRGAQGPRLRFVAVGCLAFWAGMLCKETIALLPGLVLWRTLLRQRRDEATRAHAIAAAAITAAGIAYIVPRQLWLPVALPDAFNSADNLLRDAGPMQRLWGGLAVWGHYISISIKASPLCADHTWGDLIPPTTAFGAGAAAAWLGLVAFCIALGDGLRALVTKRGGLFALAGLSALLVGHFAIPLSVILGERLALWPSVFVLWALADLLHRRVYAESATGLERLARPLGALLALTCIAWSLRTAQRSYEWRDDLSIFRSSQEACPAAVHNRVNLAMSAVHAKLPAEALWHFGVAAALRPQFPAAPQSAVFEFEANLGLTQDEAFWIDALPILPAQLGIADAPAYWSKLSDFMASQGHVAEAELAARLTRAELKRRATGAQR